MNKKLLLLLVALFSAMFLFAEDKDEDYVKFGGAVRFNMFAKGWVDSKTQPEMTIDTWRLNVKARTKGIDLNFEYRFYPTYGTHFMKQGWLGYGFGDDLYMKLGVSQVPFGITSYASHSWWFQAPYYVGLEDDYDMGLKFDYSGIENLDLTFAYYRQAEPEGPIYGGDVTFGQAGAGRYSYDIIPDSKINQSNRELNQLNLRAAYHIGETLELGFSAQVGGIYNSVADEMKTSTAFAAHIVADVAGFNFKGEFVNYNYQAVDDLGADLDIVSMGAYGTPYDVAANANMYVAGLAYTFPVAFGPISSVQAYVDYSFVDKLNDSFTDTQHLIPGMMITAGNVYTYIDYAMGKNQPWIHENFGTGLGQGETNDQGAVIPMEDLDWYTRLNINIGYYF